MDQEKLKRLRASYILEDGSHRDGSDYVTADYQVLKEKMAGRPHSANKAYSGVSTFLDLPHQEDFNGLDVAVIGVPMDLGVTNRSGARFGPRAVRDMERVGPYNHYLKEIPTTVLKAADVGDVPMRSRFSLEKSIEDIETYYKKVVAAGGFRLCIEPGQAKCTAGHE